MEYAAGGNKEGGAKLQQCHNEFSIGASASLYGSVCFNARLGRLQNNYRSRKAACKFEAESPQRQSLVKQLHERQLDSYYYRRPKWMSSAAAVRHFTLALYCSSPCP